MKDETLDKSICKSGVLEAEKTPTVQVEGNETGCELCDFSSIWNNDLKIHVYKRNDKIEQLDGVNDFVDGKD